MRMAPALRWQMPNPSSADDQPAAKAAPKPLEAEPDSALPVPKEHTMSSIAAGKLPGSEAPFRRELEASIPADLASVLAFYRSELGKLGWKEAAERAVTKPDRVQLAFTSPDGPAVLKSRTKEQRNDGQPRAEDSCRSGQGRGAAEARSGQAVARQPGRSDAAITINKQTVKIAAGAGGPHMKGPTLDLPPGKYKYAVKVAGHPARNERDRRWGRRCLGRDDCARWRHAVAARLLMGRADTRALKPAG